MRNRKLPYIHILPRVLIGVLLFGLLVSLVYIPLIANNILALSTVVDVSTALPTATPVLSSHSPTPSPLRTAAPTFAPSPEITQPPSDVVVLSAYTTLRLGDDNASVSTLQQRLTDLGYLDSDMPGTLYNESLASAVIRFQRACNMEQTGIADSATQSSLYSEEAQTYRIKRSDTGTDVMSLQQRLTELGYYTDRINGYFGPSTEQAVMSFQAVNGLTVSGELDYDAWFILYSEEALEAPSLPTPTPTPRPTPRPTTRRTASTQTSKATAKTTSKSTAKATTKATARTTSKTTSKATATLKPTATPKPASSGKKSYSSVVAAAQDQLGKPYVWGAEGPNSFDCSGLVYYCLKQSGHNVSRRNAKSYSQNGSWTLIKSMSELKAGDLVFFKSNTSSSVNHTGICISSSVMIHASSSKGQVVRSNLHQTYWETNFVCGRRP